MIRVAFDALALAFQRGGVAHYQLRLMEALERRRDVAVALHGPRKPWTGQRHLDFAIGWMAGLVSRAEADVHHMSGFWRPRGITARRAVMTAHDLLPERLARRYPEAAEARRRKLALAKEADRLIAVSQATRDELVALGKLDPGRIDVVRTGGCGLPAAAFAGEGRPPPIEKPYVLVVGRRRAEKGFDLVLNPLCQVLTKREEIDVLCVGGGDFNAQERDALSAYGLHARFHHRSLDDLELAAAYRGATLFLDAALCEGFGLTLVEAMTAGAPVLATDIPAFREIAGDAAGYFAPDDEDAFGAALLAILDDDARRAALAQAGRARAAEFSWDRAAEETVAAYARAVEG